MAWHLIENCNCPKKKKLEKRAIQNQNPLSYNIAFVIFLNYNNVTSSKCPLSSPYCSGCSLLSSAFFSSAAASGAAAVAAVIRESNFSDFPRTISIYQNQNEKTNKKEFQIPQETNPWSTQIMSCEMMHIFQLNQIEYYSHVLERKSFFTSISLPWQNQNHY